MLHPGTVIDRYIVEHLLGRGGMASVYAVKHRVLGTRHALKVLHTTRPEIRDRLVREGRLQARLDPRHVVPVTDVVDVNGSPALLMPLVQGCSLAQLLEDHRPSEAEVVALFSGVVAGVASAHTAGVIHRDLKPANVLLEIKRGVVRVRVADFGLARHAEEDDGQTRAGIFMGTPAYAAPEQIRDIASVDHRADLWSLGVMLFELLIGTRPFRADSIKGVMKAVTTGSFDRSRVPEPWRALVMGLLESDRAGRTGSATALAEALAGMTEPAALVMGSPVAEVVRKRVTAAQVVAQRESARAQATMASEMLVRPTLAPEAEAEAEAEVRHNLPTERDAFIGRASDLATLRERLDGDARLVSVLGIGGTGKTRMVTRYGWTCLGEYPGGVWFCDLSEARDAQGIVSAVARALDVPLSKDDPVIQLGNAIAGRGRCLLLLDNFEQVARHAAETLGRWLDRASEAQFVVTSREVLGLAGEQALALAPLPSSEGAALFVARSRSAKRDFEPDDVASIEALVSLLDGLPLAIELAAARVRVMAPVKLLERMSQRFKLLTSSGGRRDRQATLRATLDWSWDLLSPDEQAALAQVSVFEGGFTLDAAEEVLALDEAWPMDAVQALVDKSLIRQMSDGRFDLLVSVQEYAAERLDAAGSRPDAEARHGAHFATYGTEAALDALARHGGVALRQALALELNNLVAATSRAVIRDDGVIATATACAAWAVLEMSGPVAAGVAVLDAALGATTDTVEELRVRACLADALRQQGRMDEARDHFDAALALARGVHSECVADRSAEAALILDLGILHWQQGRVDEARDHFDTALALVREHPGGPGQRRRAEGAVLGRLGGLHMEQGRLHEARVHYDAALAAHRAVGDRRSEGNVRANLGALHFEQGRLDEALDYYDAALAVHREVGNRRSEGNVLGDLGFLHAQQGRMEQAHERCQAALSLHREVGNRRAEGIVLGNLGNLHRQQGRMDEARDHYDQALAMAREIGERRFEGYALGYLATLHRQQGRIDEARACVELGEQRLRGVGDRLGLGLILCVRARLQQADGQLEAARATLAEVENIATDLGVGETSELRRELAKARSQQRPDTRGQLRETRGH